MEWLKLFGLTTISSVSLLTILGFTVKKWFIVRITESVKHEYGRELEKYKDTLRKETDTELTKLNGKVEIEVEKAKLKHSFYSEKQFELYNELWLNLCQLKSAMDKLWDDGNSTNLWDFQEKLIAARDMLIQKAILIEPSHYNELREVINEFINYQNGEDSLIKIGQAQEKGKIFPDGHIERLITHHIDSRTKLILYIEKMRNCLQNQICGN